MPIFAYKAKEGPSKIIDGQIEATSADNAVSKIIQLGLAPIDITEKEVSDSPQKASLKPTLQFSRRVSLNDISIFTRQLCDLVDAAVPILRALEIVSQQTQRPQMKEIVEELFSHVQDGGALSEALAQHSGVFSELYINMVKTAEVSGQMEVVMARLAEHLEKEQETISKIRQSLAYPMMILLVGFLTVFVLLSFVVPRLSVMFEDFDQTLPAVTMILMGISSFFAHYWWVMIMMMITAGLYFKRWISTEVGRFKYDRFKLRVPLLGDFIKIVETGRLSRTLGTLIESGVVITTALNSVWATIINVVLRDEMRQVAEEVKNGESLKTALRGCSFFPEMATNMISVGEETGKLERGFYKVADTYERQSDRIMKTLISLLGPIVLVIIVSIVGFVVIAMILPILQMNTLIS